MVGNAHSTFLQFCFGIVTPFGRKDRQFKVAIKLVSKTDLYQLQQFLRRKQRDAPYDTIQVLDVVLRDTPSKS